MNETPELSGRALIKDVAKLAGVSPSSVSRALTPGRYASDELRARVARAVEQLGYEPNSFGQNLRVQSSRTIGCMVSDIANPLYTEILRAAETRLQEAGYLMVVASSFGGNREAGIIDMFRRRRMDGLLATLDDDRNDKIMTSMDNFVGPVVLLDRDADIACDRVSVDHRAGAHTIVSYLLGLGHRRILLETPTKRVRPGRERILGAIDAVREAGLPPSVLRVADHEDISASVVFADVVRETSSSERPTALVVLGSEMLTGALAAIAANRLRIPEDISVVSIGDSGLSQFAGPGITALRWDLKKFGATAAEMLLDRLNGENCDPRNISLPTELVLRKSCAPPVLMRSAAN